MVFLFCGLLKIAVVSEEKCLICEPVIGRFLNENAFDGNVGKFNQESTLNVRTCNVTSLFFFENAPTDYVQPARQTQLTSEIENCKKIE